MRNEPSRRAIPPPASGQIGFLLFVAVVGIVLGYLLFLGLRTTSSGLKSAPSGVTGRAVTGGAVKDLTNCALAMFDMGRYADAKTTLDTLFKTLPTGTRSDDLTQARGLQERVKTVLLDQYRSVEAARERAKVQETARAEERKAFEMQQKKMLDEGDRRFKLAQAGESPATNFEEAGRLYAQVASARAVEAFNLAADCYSQGQYEKARPIFERLEKYVRENASEPQFTSGLGAEREGRIAEYLKTLPYAKANLEQGKQLAGAAGPLSGSSRISVVH
jgi:tetratricopeptide (TPR) repeat protein